MNRVRLLAGIVAVPAAGLALLAAEAAWTATREYLPASAAPPVAGSYGPAAGRPVRLLVLGDSSAAGLGAGSTEATVGGRLAGTLAADGLRVTLASVARSGARTTDLAVQVDAVPAGPGVAVVIVGANDVNHGTGLGAARLELEAVVRRLTGSGWRVVVGTCPDLGGARAYPRPLREVAAWRGRAMAGAQRRAVLAAGGTPVDLARLTGPAFRADPGTLSTDRFHPSDRGYRLWADALGPAVRQVLPPGVRSELPAGKSLR